jgi:hypothetical protein
MSGIPVKEYVSGSRVRVIESTAFPSDSSPPQRQHAESVENSGRALAKPAATG